MDSARNPADDITQGLKLSDLANPHHLISGPDFLNQPPDQWPAMPTPAEAEPELRKSTLVCATSEAQNPDLPDPTQFHTWKDLVLATVTSLHGAAASSDCQTADAVTHISAERLLLAQAQQESFPEIAENDSIDAKICGQ